MQIEKLGLYDSLEQLFINISVLDKPFWLDSALADGHLGRYSYIGALPMAELTGYEDHVELLVEAVVTPCAQDPLAALEELMKRFSSTEKGPFPFNGGAVGYLSYDLKNKVEALPQKANDDLRLPLLQFAVYDLVIAYDHQTREAFFIQHELRPNSAEMAAELKKALQTARIKPIYENSGVRFRPDQSKVHYMASVQRIRDYIASGDVYQANYTQRIECDFKGSDLALYLRLRQVNPAPFAAYLPYKDFTVLSSSPERFIQMSDGRIETRPIKGTVKRGATAEEDLLNRRWLETSEKDRSELLMIVDLERNDLSRIAQVGTVKVPELFAIEQYATVYHLVSTVTATCDEGVTLSQILKATFPGGSITGAPKIRAMEVIDELETHARGLYTGSIGYIGFDGVLDLNIVIRTLVMKNEKLYFGVGGGIVWDSDPESEYEESLTKGKALMFAISGGEGYVLEQFI